MFIAILYTYITPHMHMILNKHIADLLKYY